MSDKEFSQEQAREALAFLYNAVSALADATFFERRHEAAMRGDGSDMQGLAEAALHAEELLDQNMKSARDIIWGGKP